MTGTGTGADLPLWAEIVDAALVLAGAAVALLGSFGLLRLPNFSSVSACQPSSPRRDAGA